MRVQVEAIYALFRAIDQNAWDRLGDFFCPDVEYLRPGYPPIRGLSGLVEFYQAIRVVESGEHRIAKVLSDGSFACCWGSFHGVSRTHEDLGIEFSDWYTFKDRKIEKRRTFFYQPAI